ncbi:MAG: protein of unknown function DUF268 [uncultured bacterium]|nr:MAG: protein of unknown function DUF268 [uncultured bacterium]HAO52661.1 hypothetical protein [Candidatus Magasanikbacteria bacterium]
MIKKKIKRVPFVSSFYHFLIFILNRFKELFLYLFFIRDFVYFKKNNKKIKDNRFELSWYDRYPCLYDKQKNTDFNSHYIYHPAWAARILSILKPDKHIDIGSILDFSTIISAFIKVDFYDYRPAKVDLDNLYSGQADLTNLLFEDNSVESLSCMHTIEHIGLGRYGDPIDPQGDLKAINELKRVVAKGGTLLFVVPVGLPKVMFNAHRIYSYEQIMDYFSGFFLKEFSLITDNQDFIRYADVSLVKKQKYGCGCFWFIKK